MADFPDNAEVRVTLLHPAGGQDHRIPQLDVTLSQDGTVVSGETAKAIREALPHTFVTEDDVRFEVDEGEPQEEVEATEAALDLALEHDLDLGNVEGTGVDGRVLKSDVQAALDEQ